MKSFTSRKRRKRPRKDTSQLGEQASSEAGDPKRHKIQPKSGSGVADTASVNEDSLTSPAQCPPPSRYDIDRLNYHVHLEDLGEELQKAANAVFSSDRRSKYTKVSALLLSWEEEDPQLPVSLEINTLKDVLVNLYGFEVEEWKIPAHDSHIRLNRKILQFLEDSYTKHLKVVYYAGHGKYVSNHGQAIWTSHQNSIGNRDRYPTVKWSGIQSALEESHSDVLILLDCCASGMSNTCEGNGVTELIAACAFNTANGVGPFSFTHALVAQLRKLIHMPSFTVGYLYNLLFTEIQGLPIEDAQRKKAPVHLVLTQDHRLPRSITISAKCPRISNPLGPPGGSGCLSMSPIPQAGSSSKSPDSSGGGISTFSSSGASPAISMSELPEYPRLLFSIRIREDIKPNHLSTELLADWLATIPLDTKSVRIEAGFASDSTLLMVSLPVAMLGYLPDNPAITMLGVTRSTNLLTLKVGDPSTFKVSVPSASGMKGEVSDNSMESGEAKELDVDSQQPKDFVPSIRTAFGGGVANSGSGSIDTQGNKNKHIEELEPPSEDEDVVSHDKANEYDAKEESMTDGGKRKDFLERNRVATLKVEERKKQVLQNSQPKVKPLATMARSPKWPREALSMVVQNGSAYSNNLSHPPSYHNIVTLEYGDEGRSAVEYDRARRDGGIYQTVSPPLTTGQPAAHHQGYTSQASYYFQSDQTYAQQPTRYDNNLVFDDDQNGTPANSGYTSQTTHYNSRYYPQQTSGQGHYNTHGNDHGHAQYSETTRRWSTEISPEDRLRLGLPRYESEEQRLAYENAGIEYGEYGNNT